MTSQFDAERRLPITDSRVVYRGAIVNMVNETFEYNGESLNREFVDHPGAAAVMAVDEQGRVAVIRQYRHAVRQTLVEIPAGLLDRPDEDPLEAAKRELAEEAQLGATTWQHLLSMNTTPGGSNEVLHVYLATGLYPDDSGFVRTEEEADFEVEWLPLTRLVDGVFSNELSNPSLVTGVLAYWATLHPTSPEPGAS